jgi:hypothetical protein
MINIDWEQFIYNHSFFGWYMNWHWGQLPRSVYWLRTKRKPWLPVTRFYRGPGVSVTVIDGHDVRNGYDH